MVPFLVRDMCGAIKMLTADELRYNLNQYGTWLSLLSQIGYSQIHTVPDDPFVGLFDNKITELYLIILGKVRIDENTLNQLKEQETTNG